MANAGPARTERDKLKQHRAEKPYDRTSDASSAANGKTARPALRRSQSIVDSLRSIVAKPFSWLTSGSAELESTLNVPPVPAVPSSLSAPVLANGNGSLNKRRASSPPTTQSESTPAHASKKRRRGASPPLTPLRTSKSPAPLRSSVSVPQLSSHSAALRPPRASFLPPLPRTSTPLFHRDGSQSIDPTGTPLRLASPAIRASPSVSASVVYHNAPRAGSVTPQQSFDENGNPAAATTAFGLRYRSPFLARGPSLSRANSIFSERASSVLPSGSALPRPRTTLVADGAETEGEMDEGEETDQDRGDSSSPTRPAFFSPAPSGPRRPSSLSHTAINGQRRTSDGVASALVPPLQAATIRRAGSVTGIGSGPFPGSVGARSQSVQRGQSVQGGRSQTPQFGKSLQSPTVNAFTRQPSIGLSPSSSLDTPLAQAHRAISHVARSTSPEKAQSSVSANTDRVFAALEEAIPWSQGRKLRHEQRARIRVPAPSSLSAPSSVIGVAAGGSTNVKLGARAGRMVQPYARIAPTNGNGNGHATASEDMDLSELEASSHAPKTNGKGTKVDEDLLEGLAAKRAAAAEKLKASLGSGSAGDDDADMEEGTKEVEKVDTTALKALVDRAGPLFPPPAPPASSSASPKKAASFLPPLGSISEDPEPASTSSVAVAVLPFALLPTTTTATTSPTTPSNGGGSSLRAGRTKTSAVHAPSASRRPGPGPSSASERPNRFALDTALEEDDEEAGGDGDETAQWAAKSGISLEVPVGWSFGGAKKVEGMVTPESAKDLNKSTPSVEGTKPSPFGAAASPFGTTAATTSPFGASPFGAPASTSNGSSTEVKKDFSAPAPSAAPTSLFAGFGGVPSSSSTSSPFSIPTPSSQSADKAKDATAETPKPSPFSFGGGGGSSPFGGVSSGGPSPFGNSALKSTPFGVPSIFGKKEDASAPAAGKPSEEKSSEETPKPSPFSGFGGATAGASKPSPFGELAKPSAPSGLFGAPTVTSSTMPAPTSTSTATSDANAAKPANTFTPSAFGGFGSGASPFGASSTPSAAPSSSESAAKPPAPSTSAPPPLFAFGAAAAQNKDKTDEKEKEAPKPSPFAWPGAPSSTSTASAFGAPAPQSQDGSKSASGLTSPPPESSKAAAPAAAPTETPKPAFASTPSFSFGGASATPTSLFGTGSAGAPASTPAPSTPAAASPFGAFPAPGSGAPFKFGASNVTTSPPLVPDKPAASPFGTPGGFGGFGASAAPSSSNGAAKPSFSFGSSSGASTFGSGSTPAFGNAPERPKTPPTSTGGDMGMETSPVQTPAAPAGASSGISPFAFGGQPGFGGTSFAFGQAPASSSLFGGAAAPAATPAAAPASSFAFSDSRPGTPSSPFGNPATLHFGAANGTGAAAPSSPFGAPPPLPQSSFSFGASNGAQQQQPVTPSQPSFGFTFSPVASPTLAPTNISAPAFVFGQGVESGSQTPATPTTPSRRPLRGLPQRKKR